MFRGNVARWRHATERHDNDSGLALHTFMVRLNGLNMHFPQQLNILCFMLRNPNEYPDNATVSFRNARA